MMTSKQVNDSPKSTVKTQPVARMNEMVLKVLLVIEGEIPTTHILERLLREAIGPLGTVSKILLSDFTPRALEDSAIPILVRIGHPAAQGMLRWLKARGISYIYYIDDNFWELEGDTPLAQYYQNLDVRRTLEMAVKGADNVVVNSELFGDYLVSCFNAKVSVLPAPFDFSLLRQEGRADRNTEEVRIGFAGSVSRNKDFVAIIPALVRILREFRNVELYFFGFCPFELKGRARVHYYSHVDSYESFIRLKESVVLDIGLAPMAQVKSNFYKTNNKYREYGALRIAGVYAACSPYSESVKHRITGLLVPQESESWYEAIASLVSDASFRQSIADAAYEDVYRSHAQGVVAGRWEKLLRAFLASNAQRRFSARRLALEDAVIRISAWVARVQLRIQLKAVRVATVVRKGVSKMGGGALS